MNKKQVAKSILKLAKSLVAENFPTHIEHWVDTWETDDYPYGRLRTKATWTVQGGHGKQRVSRVTVDPKNGRVNAPKATTYGTAAKIGIAGNRAWIVVGRPGQIAVYDGTMTYSETLFADKPHYDIYAAGLGFKEESSQSGDKLNVHKSPHGATISGLRKFTLRELMITSGLTEEDLKNSVDSVQRKNGTMEMTFTVKFKKEANRPDFIIKVGEH